MSPVEEANKNSIERHLQTLIVIIIVGLLGWVGTTVQETQVAVAKLTVEVEFMKVELAKPSRKFELINDRLTKIERNLHQHTKED